MNSRSIERNAGMLVALCAFVVFWTTRSPGAYPGASATQLTQALGLAPRLVPDHPLWFGVAGTIGSLAGPNAVAVLNGFSVLCGTAVAWLLFGIVSRAIRLSIHSGEIDPVRADVAAVLGGASATLAAAFSAPVWIACSRADLASFHMLMLLGAVRLLLLWWDAAGSDEDETTPGSTGPAYRGYRPQTSSSSVLLPALTFLCGLGIAEFATFIVVVPLIAGFVVYRLWRTDNLNLRVALRAGGAGLAGLTLYPIAAWAFYDTEGYHVRAYTGYGQVIWMWWVGQYQLIRHSLPQVGWILVLCLTAVPWLTMLVVARRALNRSPEWGLYLLHVVLAILVGLVFLDAPLSPWRILGWGRPLVTPYLLTASVLGYLVAYAYLLPQAWWGREATTGRVVKARGLVGCLLPLPLVLVVLASPFRNVEQCDGRHAEFANRMAGEIVRSMGNRRLLVTSGGMDDLVMLSARGQGRRVHTVNMANRTEVYARTLARRFPKPSHVNRIGVDIGSFVVEWLHAETNVADNVAVLDNADLWLAGGASFAPDRLIYLGTATKAVASEAEGILRTHDTFWRSLSPPRPGPVRQPADAINAALVRHVGAVANNVGVLLEDAGRPADAFATYQTSRRIDTNNISALLNMNVMVDRGFVTDARDAVRADLEALRKGLKQRVHTWTLSRYYGFVRAPEAYASMGWGWVRSGQPGAGILAMNRAVELALDAGQRQRAEQMLAYAHLLRGESDASEAIYGRLVAENPSNAAARVGMARLASRRGDFQAAGEWLEKAQRVGGSSRDLSLEWAELHMASGAFDKARLILERIVDEDPAFVQGWVLLASIHHQQRDEAGLRRCLDRLDSMRGSDWAAGLVRAQVAMERMDLATARRGYEAVHKAQPRNASVLERLLQIDMLETKRDGAQTHVMALLRLNPDHGLANYVMGSLQVADGKYDLAEDSLRRSVAARPTPAAHNDMAWLLARRGRFVEAEEQARAAVAMRKDMWHAWDTLATIQMQTGRIKDAKSSLAEASSLAPDEPVLSLHRAEVHLIEGEREAAAAILDAISTKRAQMSLEDQKHYDELRLSLSVQRP
jgi:predicted Zn-dependent protease